jgi:hypothetical protein
MKALHISELKAATEGAIEEVVLNEMSQIG